MELTELTSAGSPELDQVVSDRVFTAANIITMARLALVPVALALLLLGYDLAATVIFAVTAITDFLDGYVARKTNTVSRLGQFLDPLVDRVLILAAVLGLLLVDRLPLWIVLLIIARDVYLVVGAMYLLRSRHVRVSVSYIGKAAMWALCIGFAGLILNAPILNGLGWVDAAWLPGFSGESYCAFMWFVYIGVALSLFVACLYTKRGIDALSVAKINGEGV